MIAVSRGPYLSSTVPIVIALTYQSIFPEISTKNYIGGNSGNGKQQIQP
jgi:hypothetical protein